jgi:hypothetical protein
LAIEKAEEAMSLVLSDHLGLAGSLNNLGARQMLARDPVRADNALSSLRKQRRDSSLD